MNQDKIVFDPETASEGTRTVAPSLQFVVSKMGKKRWNYRTATEFIPLGKYPEISSVEEAIEKIKQITKAQFGFETAWTKYLETKNEKRAKELQYVWKVIAPELEKQGVRSLKDMTAKKMKDVLQAVAKRKFTNGNSGLKAAYRCYGSLKDFYLKIGSIIPELAQEKPDYNPFLILTSRENAIGAPEPKVNHFKSLHTKEELKEFLDKVKAAKGYPIARSYILALIYLPLRPEEMSSLKFSDVCEKNGQKCIHIPKDRVKTKVDLYFPLTEQIKEIIESNRHISGGDYVFPNKLGGDSHVWRNMANEFIKRVGFADRICRHGLRATFRTIAEDNLRTTVSERYGISIDSVRFEDIKLSESRYLEKVLGHMTKEDRQAGSYNHSKYIDEMHRVLTNWNDFVDSL